MADGGGLTGSLFAKVAWGIVLGFLLLHGVSFFYYGHERMLAEGRAFASSVVDRALTIERLGLADPDLLEALQSPFFSVAREAAPPEPGRPWPHSDEIEAAVRAELAARGYERAGEVRLWFTARPRPPHLVVVVPAAPSGYLVVEAATHARLRSWDVVGVFWMGLLLVGVLVLVLWVTRRVLRYFPQFVEAAERVGRHSGFQPLPAVGPLEVRRASDAFNRMQARVAALLEERSAMLAAFSHDLRTLVARLALRAEDIASDEQRRKAEEDLTAITRLLDEAQAFARDERSDEADVRVDLGSLLQSLVDDETDLGNTASFDCRDAVVLHAQPVALKRAFANLIGNAIRYGEAAHVVLEKTDDAALVRIVDRGPGIPAADRQAVLRPYVRLESSRSRETGGSGLGLAIANNVVGRHGGMLEFLDGTDGFTVAVRLPLTGRSGRGGPA